MPQCAGGGVVRWSPLWQKNGVSPILFACKENEKFTKEFVDLWDNSAAAESSINCCFIVTLTCYPFSFHRMARRRLMNLNEWWLRLQPNVQIHRAISMKESDAIGRGEKAQEPSPTRWWTNNKKRRERKKHKNGNRWRRKWEFNWFSRFTGP